MSKICYLVTLIKSPLNYKEAIKFLDQIQPLGYDNMYEAQLHIYQDFDITFKFIGTLDSENKFHGYSVLKIFPSHHCYKGVCDHIKYETLRGSFKHGVLEGLISLTSHDNSLITFTTLKEGIAHGMVMTHGMLINQYYYPRKKSLIVNKKQYILDGTKQKGMGRIAKFVNGKISKEDPVWQGVFGIPLDGQGYMYGKLQADGQIGGNNEAYIYPWTKLALLGQFKGNN